MIVKKLRVDFEDDYEGQNQYQWNGYKIDEDQRAMGNVHRNGNIQRDKDFFENIRMMYM